jgi:hypothetical protein
LHIITCQPCDVMCKSITRRVDVRNLVLLGHLPNAGSDCVCLTYGH